MDDLDAYAAKPDRPEPCTGHSEAGHSSDLTPPTSSGNSAPADSGDVLMGVEQILPVVYDELKRLAQNRMNAEPPGHTLQPTALVHEVYLRLLRDGREDWADRTYFMSAAAVAMRRILIERARRYRSLKHGGRRGREPLSSVAVQVEEHAIDLLALDDALTKLAAIDERKCSIVTLRYLLGCTVDETAAALGVSSALVKREWSFSKVWLRRELDHGDGIPRQGKCDS